MFTDERFGRVVRFYFGMGGILSGSSKKVNSVKPEVVWTHKPLLLANELCLCEEYNKKHGTECSPRVSPKVAKRIARP